MKVYVASSWRNELQPAIVLMLKDAGHEVYDFRHPDENDNGFHWSEIDPNWKNWEACEYVRALKHPIAQSGFNKDMAGLRWADACVLVMPCGRSAHLELGYAIGAGKKTIIYLGDNYEPELMYAAATAVALSPDAILRSLKEPEPAAKGEGG